MDTRHFQLLNSEYLEAIPAKLARPRGNATARALARADWLIRRKSDGRFLATLSGSEMRSLFRNALPGHLRSSLRELMVNDSCGDSLRPLGDLTAHLDELGLDATDYADRSGLSLIAEPRCLAFAGYDRFQRPLWLIDAAAVSWRRMRHAASNDGTVLDAISGYRSHAYQLGIFRRKRARGQTVEDILAVNAAPGFSEHHSGCALDIGTPGEPPAEESFESTAAFGWLCDHASEFGFRLSYPRDNPHGIVYEPWHWCWQN